MLFLGCDSSRTSKIVFANREYKFPAPFIAGSAIATTFTFTNEGNAPLHIRGLDADCGCVATNTSAPQIPTGGKGEIRVEIDRDVGHFLQNVAVYTNDPVTPKAILQISGVILPPIAYPKIIRLGTREEGGIVTETIPMTNHLQHAVEITAHTASNDKISVMIPQNIIPAGGSAEILVVLTLEKVGFYSELLTFHVVSGEAKKELVIQFQGRVRGEITVLPANLFLGVLSPSGGSVERVVRIKTDGEQAFALLNVTADFFEVTAEIPTRQQTTHELILSFTPNRTRKGLVEETIQIQSDHPNVPQIDIYVKGVLP